MEIQTIFNFLAILLVVAAVIVGAMIAMFFAVKKRDDLDERVQVARDDIRQRRKQRLQLMRQALAMFGNGNPMENSLSKLADLYLLIDSEEKEILWEEKYVVIMKKFLSSAKETMNANMAGARDLAEQSVLENEEALEAARTVYDETIQEMDALEKPPMLWLVQGGDKVMSFMRVFAEQARQEEERQREEAEDAEKDERKQEEDDLRAKERTVRKTAEGRAQGGK